MCVFSYQTKNFFVLSSFENLAVEVIDSCHNADEKKAENLLIRQIPEFGHLTSIQIAFSANRMKFIG